MPGCCRYLLVLVTLPRAAVFPAAAGFPAVAPLLAAVKVGITRLLPDPFSPVELPVVLDIEGILIHGKENDRIDNT